MITGVVTAVDRVWSGGTLSADVTAAATVLPLDDAGDFDEEFDEPRYLVIGEETTPREYVAVENDEDLPNTVTLAAPVGATYEAGLPVVLWDPEAEAQDKRAVEWSASVRLDDADDAESIPATIPHEQIPMAGPYSLVGARVSLAEEDEDDWYVSQVMGREPTIEGVFVFNPKARAVRSTPQSIPHDTWTRLVGAARINVVAIGSGATSGLYVPEQPGEYLVAATARFEANATGQREIVVAVDGVRSIGVSLPPAPGADSVQVVDVPLIHPSDATQGGKEIEVQVRQTSGASLAVTNFQIKITRIAPL